MKQALLLCFFSAGFWSAAQQNYRAEHALLKTIVPNKVAKPLAIYKVKPAVELPVTAAAAGFTFYGFSKIYNKDVSPVHEVQTLNKANINGFDRWAAGLHSETAAKTSDMFFYGSMPVPLLLLLDKDIRKDAPKIGLLYVEAMSVTGLLYTGSAMLVDRYRPLTYSSEVPLENRISGNNRNAFFAGHVALVGTSTFFAAKVFSDYHPQSKLRYVFWGAAAAATGTTAYLRHRGGKHFPSDLVLGTAVGALSGILVPQFHKIKQVRNSNFTLLPFSGRTHGVAMLYHL